jgi:hypothetical protein
VVQSGPNGASLIRSTSLPIRVVKLIRDYGALIFVAGLLLIFAPPLIAWLIAAFTLVNGGYLLASIAVAARASLR